MRSIGCILLLISLSFGSSTEVGDGHDDSLLAFANQNTVYKEFTLNITQNYVNSDGVYKQGFHINGKSPGPPIEGLENDWVRVTVNNHAPTAMTIHFHGILQRGTPWSDGVSGITQDPIGPGHSFVYEFQVKNQYGFTWYHAHHRGYLTDGVYGPMNFVPKLDRERPYSLITNNTGDLKGILKLEKNPTYLMGDDSFKWNMDTIMARMFDYGIDPLCIQSVLINGKGRITCHEHEVFENLKNKEKSPIHMKSGFIDRWGCLRMENGYSNATDLQGLEMPGYYESCTPTMTDQFELKTVNSKWHYFNVINVGGQFTKAFSIDGHKLWVVAIDGIFIEPKEVHQIILPVGTRVSIVVKAKIGTFKIRFAATFTPQYIEGIGYITNEMTDDSGFDQDYNPVKYQDIDGKLLDKSYVSIWPRETVPFESSAKYSLGEIQADHTFKLYLNRTGMITFTMFENGTMLPPSFEHDKPMLYNFQTGTDGGNWVLRDNLQIGDIVDIIINNSNSMGHPVHLHGHLFHVISHSDSTQFEYSSIQEAVEEGYTGLISNPPFFDITYIPPNGHSVIRFIADNPGIWLIHCHNLGHLIGGMGAVLLEAEDNLVDLLSLKNQ